ncbi:MAG: spermidine/putrescine ABC transporter substrate-binding protein [delta proteobacterium MLS_D]|nr:MAG: spermidine/putrescine ABC transporter substrate-binding protein [delta proteobacterium MLS_D]
MDCRFVRTTCPFCGTGCGMLLKVVDGRVVDTLPDRESVVGRGHLCIKGWSAHEFVHHPDRLTHPLVKKGDSFERISWEEAISLAAEKFRGIAEQYGNDAIGGFSSAKCTNEENYLFQKLIRAGFQNNNVDHCARL